MPVTSGTVGERAGASAGWIVMSQKNSATMTAAMTATPVQIHATGGPDWVRVMVLSVLS